MDVLYLKDKEKKIYNSSINNFLWVNSVNYIYINRDNDSFICRLWNLFYEERDDKEMVVCVL